MTMLSGIIIMLLPRQFHVMVVENRDENDTRRASWMFPSYLVLINLFVIPIALAGDLLLPPGGDKDMTVLALPLQHNQPFLALFAFLGGLSAATAMVIMECVALAIMISNDLVIPSCCAAGRCRRGGRLPGDMGRRSSSASAASRSSR